MDYNPLDTKKKFAKEVKQYVREALAELLQGEKAPMAPSVEVEIEAGGEGGEGGEEAPEQDAHPPGCTCDECVGKPENLAKLVG